MRKFLCLFLALITLLSCCTTALAASPYDNYVTGMAQTDKTILKKANEFWNENVPDWLKKEYVDKGWKIVVADKDLYYTHGVVAAAGVTVSSEKAIYLNNITAAVNRAMLHELGHFVDATHGRPSETAEFKEIFEAEKDAYADIHAGQLAYGTGDWPEKVANHHKSTPSEYFAQVFSDIILDGEKSLGNIPCTFKYVVKAAGSGMLADFPIDDPESQAPDKNGHTHSYTETKVDASCTTDGYSTFTCSCGDTYTGNERKAVGHKYTERKESRLNFDKKGYYSVYSKKTCKNCGHETKWTKVDEFPAENNTSSSGPKITQQPKKASAKSGSKVSVTVKAEGKGLKYQWYYAEKGSSKFKKSSISSKTYSSTMNKDRDGRRIYCVITDSDGNSVKTNVVTISLKKTALKITKDAASVSVKNGKKASIAVKAQGDGLKYQWYIASKGSSKFSKSSIKTNTYSVTASKSNNGRRVYCVITDTYGNTVKTKTATIKLK